LEGALEYLARGDNMWELWCTLYEVGDCYKIQEAFQTLCDEDHIHYVLMRGYMWEKNERCFRYVLRDYSLGMDIRCTSYCADLPEVIIGIIMMFIDWDDNVKFGYLSDAIRREVKVVLIFSVLW
jgi:hypothetical protein